MTTTRDRIIAWVGLLALLALHIDFWRPARPDLYFGWLPEELAYRLVWMAFAWLYLMFFTRRIWRDEDA